MQTQIDKGQQTPTDEVQKGNSSSQQLRILSRFIIKEKLGSGSFGHIYKAFDQERNEFVALKIEPHSHSNNLTLNREAKILNELEGGTGLPSIYYYSKEDNYSLLAMTLLGNNLEKLFKSCSRKFSLQTVLMLADQMIRRIEYIHSKGYLHRDIKPENFVMGPQRDQRSLYLIDFGLSKMYRDSSGKHNSYKEGRGLVGTARYASISTHIGIEQSRRDDLESIGYLLIYFLKGVLPWQNIKSQSKAEKYKLIADCKLNTTIEELCKDIPKEFTIYMNYVRNLAFTDQPDYKYLKKIFRQLLVESGYRFDFEYDWCRTGSKGPSEYRNLREIKNVDKNVENEELEHIDRKKHQEVYAGIKNKALVYNLEFREKNGALAFAPPRNASKGNGTGRRERLFWSPDRKVPLNRQTFTSAILDQPNPSRKNNFKTATTLAHIKSSGNDSPSVHPGYHSQINTRRAGRNMMPDKPCFTPVNFVVLNEGDHSSPKSTVSEGGSSDFREDQIDLSQEQEKKNLFDEAAEVNPTQLPTKRWHESKSKTMGSVILKDREPVRAENAAMFHKTGKMLSTNNVHSSKQPQPNLVDAWRTEVKRGSEI